MNIELLVKQFRKSIDTAFDRGEFHSHPPFTRFPNDCCDFACDLLGQFLLEHGIATRQVRGTHRTDPFWYHVWLITNDEVVIDITCDQFVGKLVSEKDVAPVYIGPENKVHRIFCLNRLYDSNTNFTDATLFTGFGGMPNRRQHDLMEIYKIIYRYIE